MRFDLSSALVLSTLTVSSFAATILPKGKAHNNAVRHAESMGQRVSKQDINLGTRAAATSLVTATDATRLSTLGISIGVNAISQNSIGTAWVGTDGTFKNTFQNNGTDPLLLVIWGPAGSWVTAIQPHLTLSLASGQSQTVSFPLGWSGAWSALYPTTTLVNAQISETWGEATFNPPYSVVDVSREVNLGGRSMSIVGPQCTSNMNTCVFKCSGGATTCEYNYELDNCATGSQPGANYGTYGGAPSGGCGGMGTSASLNTYLGGS